jgi:hypothetical protein
MISGFRSCLPRCALRHTPWWCDDLGASEPDATENGGQTWLPPQYVMRVISERRKRAATATRVPFSKRLRKRWRSSSSGALTRKPWSSLELVSGLRPRLHIAERRAARKARIISTQPSALLGSPAVSPAYSPCGQRSRRPVSRTCCCCCDDDGGGATLRPLLDFPSARSPRSSGNE